MTPNSNGTDVATASLAAEMSEWIAGCCTRTEPIHGRFFQSAGTVGPDGQIIIEHRLINFGGDDLIIRAVLRFTELVTVYPDDRGPAALPVGVGSLDLPPDGAAA